MEPFITMDGIVEQACTYCGEPGAAEDDHVIARQFFPSDGRYRDSLPKVPSCGRCNRQKQRVEDTAGVLFLFGDGSEASRRVLSNRVPRTLKKNARLHRSLRRGLEEVLLRSPAGVLVPATAINVSAREQRDAHQWFRLVARGVYFLELKTPLPQDHTIHLLRPVDERFNVFRDLMLSARTLVRRAFADGHFRYAFAHNAADEVSMAFLEFKSIWMFTLTLPPSATHLRDRIAIAEWARPGE